MTRPLDIVFIGLTLSSSWGNGHATTYRALLGGLDALGHRVTFLERDVPWYADSRDLAEPDFCDLVYYRSLEELGRLQPHRTVGAADSGVGGERDDVVPRAIPGHGAGASETQDGPCGDQAPFVLLEYARQ